MRPCVFSHETMGPVQIQFLTNSDEVNYLIKLITLGRSTIIQRDMDVLQIWDQI